MRAREHLREGQVVRPSDDDAAAQLLRKRVWLSRRSWWGEWHRRASMKRPFVLLYTPMRTVARLVASSRDVCISVLACQSTCRGAVA